MKKNSTDDVWVDANNIYIVYHFNGLEELEIEADENTEFIMTRLTQNINEELKPEEIED
jgi:hypothetical protein